MTRPITEIDCIPHWLIDSRGITGKCLFYSGAKCSRGTEKCLYKGLYENKYVQVEPVKKNRMQTFSPSMKRKE